MPGEIGLIRAICKDVDVSAMIIRNVIRKGREVNITIAAVELNSIIYAGLFEQEIEPQGIEGKHIRRIEIILCYSAATWQYPDELGAIRQSKIFPVSGEIERPENDVQKHTDTGHKAWLIKQEGADLKRALTPLFPGAANSKIERTEKDGVTTITVVKLAGSKGSRRKHQDPAPGF